MPGNQEALSSPFFQAPSTPMLGLSEGKSFLRNNFWGGKLKFLEQSVGKHLGQNQERGEYVVAKKKAFGKSWGWGQEKKAVGDWSHARSSEYSCHQGAYLLPNGENWVVFLAEHLPPGACLASGGLLVARIPRTPDSFWECAGRTVAETTWKTWVSAVINLLEDEMALRTCMLPSGLWSFGRLTLSLLQLVWPALLVLLD